MASIKGLKKDIRFLSGVVIADAIYMGDIVTKAEDKKAMYEVVVSAIDMHNEFISRANHPDGKDNPQLIKKYYKSLTQELMQKCDAMFTTLNDMYATL